MRLDRLTLWQRMKRRLLLLGGSYRHPDGTIELDFEAPAQIDPWNDSDEAQARKLDTYHKRQAEQNHRFWYFVAGAIFGASMIHYWPQMWPF